MEKEKTYYICKCAFPTLWRYNMSKAEDYSKYNSWSLLMPAIRNVLKKHPSIKFRININAAILDFNSKVVQELLLAYCKSIILNKQ